MALTREEVSSGLLDELTDFELLIRGLDDDAWHTPTRCEGWTVSDIAAHVIGTLTEVLAGRVAELGHPGSVDRIVADRRGKSPAELADELAEARKGATKMLAAFDDDAWRAPVPGGVAADIGDGVTALWYDAYVHEEDIRAALGMPQKRGPGLRASVSHLADLLERDGWGPATVATDGLEEFPIGEGGPRVDGDPLEFVLVATGRADPSRLGLDDTVNVYRPR